MKTWMFHQTPPNQKGYSVTFSRHSMNTRKLKLKYKPMLPSNHVYQSDAAGFPALHTVPAELCFLKIHDPYLFARTAHTFSLSFSVKGQNKTLINDRKYDTVCTHSFNLWIDRPLRAMLGYAATANQSTS